MHITEKWSFTDRESRLGQSGGRGDTSNPFRQSFDTSYNSSLTSFHFHFETTTTEKTCLEFVCFHNFFPSIFFSFILPNSSIKTDQNSNDAILCVFLPTKVRGSTEQLKLMLLGQNNFVRFELFLSFTVDLRWRKKSEK